MEGVYIHPTAIVSKNVQLGVNVKIGPFTIIEDNVEIGDNTEIRSSVVIASGTKIGANCKIFASTIIGTEPQDLKYKGEPTNVIIGERNTIREFVTINRGTKATGKTSIGNDNLIMAYCHIAHDCHLGSNIIMSNVSQLAGHVEVEDWVIFGAFAKVHQFCKVGCHSMVGADVKAVKDIPPYTLIGREPPQVEGINIIGLKRRNFPTEVINAINEFYHTILFSGYNTTDGINKYLSENNVISEVQHCIDFIRKSERGIYR